MPADIEGSGGEADEGRTSGGLCVCLQLSSVEDLAGGGRWRRILERDAGHLWSVCLCKQLAV
jgi:hypothetical protein